MKAVIFDNDGVVIDSEPLIFEATAQAFAEKGVTIQQEDIVEGIGAGAKYVQDPMEKYGMTEVSLTEMLRLRARNYRQIIPGRLKTVPGFFELTGWLRQQGYKMALASSATTEDIQLNLATAKVPQETFDAIVDSDRIVNKKPAPDLFLQAATMIGVEPRHCLVVEDARPGVTAAKRAAMRVVALATSCALHHLAEAEKVFANHIELLNWLKGCRT